MLLSALALSLTFLCGEGVTLPEPCNGGGKEDMSVEVFVISDGDGDGDGDLVGARADSAGSGQESAPMTEEEAAFEGLFHAGLLPVMTLFPPPLSESSVGGELTATEASTTGGGGGEVEEGGAAAATIWLQGEETPGLGE